MQAGEQIAGRYRLDTRLGRGGMGEVWRAFDVALGRPVAVKVLIEVDTEHESLQRFRREASIGARLQHPGITVVHDVGHHDGRLFLVMELLEGTDLAHLLARSPHGGLPLTEAVELGAQTAEALAAAHAGKVVHRDLKPANLFLQTDGRLKICDFGIAWTAEATEGLTVTGRPFGSPPYMSPEQWRGEHVTVRCDLYALGCVLHALLTGGPPFPAGENPWALMRRHLEDVPPPLRSVRADVPAGVEALVAELLAKDPAARPDAVAVARRLRSAVAPGPPTYTPMVLNSGAPADVPTVTAPGGGARGNSGAGAGFPTPPAAGAAFPTAPGADPGPTRGPRRRSLLIGGVAALAAATGGTLAVLRKGGGGQKAEEIFTLSHFTDAVYAVAYSPDSKTLVTGGGGNGAAVWNIPDGSPAGTLTASGHPHVRTVACSPNGKTIATAGPDGDILLWGTAGLGAAAQLLVAGSAPCNILAFSPDSATLAAGSDDTTVTLWDVAGGKQNGTLKGVHREPVLSVAYSPDGKSLLSADSGGTVVLWNNAEQTPYGLVDSRVAVPAKASSVAFAPHSKVFASATGSLRLWTGPAADRFTLLSSAGSVYALAFSPDGSLMATGSGDGTVELRSVASQKVVTSLRVGTGLVQSLAFAPDGRTLAASGDRIVQLWTLHPSAA